MTADQPRRISLRERRIAQTDAGHDARVRERIDLLRRSDPYASPEAIARRVGVSVETVLARTEEPA